MIVGNLLGLWAKADLGHSLLQQDGAKSEGRYLCRRFPLQPPVQSLHENAGACLATLVGTPGKTNSCSIIRAYLSILSAN